MYIDQKFTGWKRFCFPDNIEIPHFKSEYEIDEFINDNMISLDLIDGTEEDMTLKENDGYSTLEVYNDKNVLIWENGKSNN